MQDRAPERAEVEKFARRNPIQAAMMVMDRKSKRLYLREYEARRKTFPTHMVPTGIPDDLNDKLLGVWQSCFLMAAAWKTPWPEVLCRLTLNRVELKADGSWQEGITWDVMQQVKSECGFGDKTAIEVYPADAAVVNVANMRHMFVLHKHLPFTI